MAATVKDPCQEVQRTHSFGPLLESRRKKPAVHLFLYFTLDLQGCCVALPVHWRGVPHLHHTLHECVLTCSYGDSAMKQPLKQTPPLTYRTTRLVDSNVHVGRCISLGLRAVLQMDGEKAI